MTDPIETEARELLGTPTYDPGRFGLFYPADKAIRTLCVILRHRNEIMAERDSTLRERNELREALRPFAEQSNDDLKFYADDLPLRKLTTFITLTVGDLRRAAALLKVQS